MGQSESKPHAPQEKSAARPRTAADLLDPTAEVFVQKHSSKVTQNSLPYLPKIQTIRHATAAEHESPFYFANAESHSVPGGGIAFHHGKQPLHEVQRLTANYVASS